jgi:hypothetical protein
MIRNTAERHLQEKRIPGGRPEETILERLAHTSEIATFEELLRVKQQLLSARKNLD